MAKHPKKMSVRPEYAAASADVLADVLDAARFSSVIYRRLELGAPWGLRIPARGHVSFYVVSRGGGWLEVAGAAPIALSAGDAALLPHGSAHVLRDAPGTKTRAALDTDRREASGDGGPWKIGGAGPSTSMVAGCFELASGARNVFFDSLPAVLHLPASDAGAAPWLSATVQLIVAESHAPGPASGVVLRRLADVLFVQALRALAKRDDCGRQGLRALTDPAIGQSLRLMHARAAEPWTVQTLAAAVGLSRSGFAARFTGLVGEPPLQYLARWRMTQAATLLLEREQTPGTVAPLVGYRSGPAFNKAFKRWQGSAPGAFRRAARAG
jgi:AraC-like DNA-binding protein